MLRARRYVVGMGKTVGSHNEKPFVRITPEIMRHVLDELSTGRTLTAICREDPGMPTPAAIVILANRDPDFGSAYNFARRIGFEVKGDALLEKGERAIGLESMAQVQGLKLSTEVDRWVMARAHPELWGDNLRVEHRATVRMLEAGDPDGFSDVGATVIEGRAATVMLPNNQRWYDPVSAVTSEGHDQKPPASGRSDDQR
jgi:hypothetical protein